MTIDGRWRVEVILAVAITLWAPTLAAREGATANYVYANYLGSGYYTVANQEVAIIKMPFSLQRHSDGPYASRWRLPVSIGSYSFKFDPQDVGNTRLPRDVATLTFVPGIEWTIPLSDLWHLEPYIDLGVGTSFSNHENVMIYSVGISSFYELGDSRQYEWVNRILYAGDYGFSSKPSTNYATLQTGIDWRLPVDFAGGSRRYFVTLYSMAFWHFNQVELVSHSLNAVTLRNSFEVGLTLGARNAGDSSAWFDLNRFGLGYRFGDGLRSVRIFFSEPI